jgi:hypothetical protein
MEEERKSPLGCHDKEITGLSEVLEYRSPLKYTMSQEDRRR